jgi:putative sigma-54 modulation protein
MLWNLHAKDVVLDEDMKDHLERRLLFALTRFDPRILRVDVHVADHNGPKGGIDKSCRIVVRLRGLGDVVVKTADADWTVCIDRATTRIGAHVRRVLARRREYHGGPM